MSRRCRMVNRALTNAFMSRTNQIVLLFAVSIAILACLVVFNQLLGGSVRGDDYVVRISLPASEGEVGLPTVQGPPDASRPLVVIDPGHGGHDPGASKDDVLEKDVTLAIAQAVRDELLASGGVRVALTREDDRYLMLAERSSIARRLKADLFLSVHADSVENDSASGASVYVLSQEGSSEAAARIAERENGADVVNGVRLNNENDVVNAILLDLAQSEAQAGSAEVAQLVLRELRGRTRLHRDKVQSAAFAVLKAPDVPSVLLETGYISNADDAGYLVSEEGRKAISGAAARAVRAYFARRSGA